MKEEFIKRAVNEVTVIVPSYEPDEKLEKVVTGLEAEGFTDIIVIDDGSSEKNKPNFPDPAKHPSMTLLVHEVNKGKGAALKTAIDWFLKNRPGKAGVVTADGDAQHRPQDVAACAARMLEEDGAPVLGVRDFSLPHVPKRSRMGNRITCFMFRIMCGMKISDTQTGLRALPASCLEDMLKVEGDRYEYETNMLLSFKSLGIRFVEETIETVYIEENQTSHFRPVCDSIRIYSLILKFCASSLISTVVDLLMFYLLMKFLAPNLPASLAAFDSVVCTVLARVVSTVVNYTINRHAVFRSKESFGKTFGKYIAIAIPVMLVSGFGVKGLCKLLKITIPSLTTVIKMVVDTILYFVNFRVQREWVFVGSKKNKDKSEN